MLYLPLHKFEKNEFENLYPELSYEPYQRVNIYTCSVGDNGLKNNHGNMELIGIYSLQIEHYALKSPFVFSAIVSYSFLQLIILFMEPIRILS